MKTKIKILLNLMLLLSFWGCSSMRVQPTCSSTIEPTPGVVVTPRISPSPAFTAILRDIMPEKTPLIISAEPNDITIRELYNDGVCKLPCWWGIKPGETSMQDVYRKLAHLGEFRDMTSLVDTMNHFVFTFTPPKDIDLYDEGQWSFTLVESDGLVKGITVGATHLEPFSKPTLAQILTTFGKPEEIWISVQEHQIDPPSFHLDLFYPNIGILVIGKGNAKSASRTDNSINASICPQNMQTTPNNQVNNKPILFHLWNPAETLSHHELRTTRLEDENNYRLLNTLSAQVSEEKFYNTYIHHDATSCFDLSWKWNP